MLEYEKRDGSRNSKEIDLLHLTAETDVEVLVNQIVFEEALISKSRKPQLRRLIYKVPPSSLAAQRPARLTGIRRAGSWLGADVAGATRELRDRLSLIHPLSLARARMTCS